jgi:thiol-disulfide isomerase/thioredoxin/cell division septation protein DedD
MWYCFCTLKNHYDKKYSGIISSEQNFNLRSTVEQYSERKQNTITQNYKTTIMRNRLILMLLLMAPIFMSFSAVTTKVDFFTGNMSLVKDRAATEGKLYFVDFTASWCMPCRWMDETTFMDPTLAKYISENYIAVKVDIDDFDGYAFKQIHNIKQLPSILIFDSKGKVVDRYEESLSATRFLDILKKHNTAANRVKTKSNTTPTTTTATPAKPSGPISRPPLANTTPQPTTPTPPATKPAPTATTKATPAKPIPTGDGLYRFKVSRQPSQGFSVQIGAFADYGNVLIEAARLEKMFEQPIIVHIATLQDKTVYKVMIGEFKSREEADKFKAQVKAKGIEAIIKDLSVMG